MRQFSKLTDLNLLAVGWSKVAGDGFEPAILRWQAGIASKRPQARSLKHIDFRDGIHTIKADVYMYLLEMVRDS